MGIMHQGEHQVYSIPFESSSHRLRLDAVSIIIKIVNGRGLLERKMPK
jgi:hypothetical protein